MARRITTALALTVVASILGGDGNARQVTGGTQCKCNPVIFVGPGCDCTTFSLIILSKRSGRCPKDGDTCATQGTITCYFDGEISENCSPGFHQVWSVCSDAPCNASAYDVFPCEAPPSAVAHVNLICGECHP